MKSALAPHSYLSVSRQRGAEPPPHSSVKSTFLPSLLNVAECQNDKFESAAASMRIGFATSRDVEQQAVAAARAAGEADVGIHRDVVALVRTGRRSAAAAAASARAAAAAPAAAGPRGAVGRRDVAPPRRGRRASRRLPPAGGWPPRPRLDACAARGFRSWKMRAR